MDNYTRKPDQAWGAPALHTTLSQDHPGTLKAYNLTKVWQMWLDFYLVSIPTGSLGVWEQSQPRNSPCCIWETCFLYYLSLLALGPGLCLVTWVEPIPYVGYYWIGLWLSPKATCCTGSPSLIPSLKSKWPCWILKTVPGPCRIWRKLNRRYLLLLFSLLGPILGPKKLGKGSALAEDHFLIHTLKFSQTWNFLSHSYDAMDGTFLMWHHGMDCPQQRHSANVSGHLPGALRVVDLTDECRVHVEALIFLAYSSVCS